MKPAYLNESAKPACATISQVLGALGERWTLITIRVLGQGPFRFNALQREIGEISPKMLASTLRNLERNGLVNRTVTPSTPPRVDYELTPLGESLQGPICEIAQWAMTNGQAIETARYEYDAREDGESAPTRLAAE